MRPLVFLRNEQLVWDFLTTGAFDGLKRQGAAFIGEGAVPEAGPLAIEEGYVGSVEPPSRERGLDYVEVRELLLTSYRFKSRTVRWPRSVLARTVVKLGAMLGRRQLRIARLLRRTGLRAEVTDAIRRTAPDLVVAPSGGIHASEFDFLRSARALGIPSLALMYNWDNLSSKSAFVTRPDYLGVVGCQSAEHARTIHGFPDDRVEVLGSPYIDSHFRHKPGSSESPSLFATSCSPAATSPSTSSRHSSGSTLRSMSMGSISRSSTFRIPAGYRADDPTSSTRRGCGTW
ncbi:MAG: hypothetical protein WKF96_14625 [Solirubrobacteraceae bacterium]